MVLNAFQSTDSHAEEPNGPVSLIKGPLEYISDLELPDEQLGDNANTGETLSSDVLDSCLMIAQNVSPVCCQRF